MDKTIQKRQSGEKSKIIEHLRKTPIVQIACDKSGVSRATYYRWLKDDIEFAKNTDQAISDGSLLVNDMAESQLMSAIRDKNLTAITFWLKHHHPKYTTKVEVMTIAKQLDEDLTPEQEALIRKALEMASLIPAKVMDTEKINE